MFSCCEFTKVILQSKSWCEMFVLKQSGILYSFYIHNAPNYVFIPSLYILLYGKRTCIARHRKQNAGILLEIKSTMPLDGGRNNYLYHLIYTFLFSHYIPNLQNFLDPGLAKLQSQLNLIFKIQTWVKHNRTLITQNPFNFSNLP